MKHEYVNLNNVQTHLITWDEPANCKGKDVIICITGNPGIPDFYIDFGAQLHRNMRLPVCIIGQAGHEEVFDKKSNILEGQEHLFNLKGQLKHKIELITNYIDKDSRLHLVGHSIGAWLILELVNDERISNRQICSVNLLFPTLQRMADTMNGKFLNSVIRNAHVIFMFLFHLAFILPDFAQNCLIKTYLKMSSLPPHYCNSIKEFVKPTVGEKVLFLAYNEMDTVKELNEDAIDKIKNITNVIYSSHDNWTPLNYIEDLKKFEPEITLQNVKCDHAFVLKSSIDVAEMVANFISAKNLDL